MQLRLLSLFSGIGAFEKALALNGMDYELVNYCEIDKYAAKAYSLIHNVPEDLNLKDVTKVDTSKLHNIDMVTYAFPCQDISSAGKRQGFVDSNGNRTRSGLFFEALRIIKDTQPKYAIAENVKNLVSKKFRTEFETVISELDKVGYVSYYDVLNAKDYGIPQNRERVFIVSIRKDLHQGFNFPKGEPLKLRLKDLLEPEVDSHYYHNDDRTKRFLEKLNLSNVSNEPNIQRVGGYTNYLSAQVISPSGISKTIAARDYKDAQSIIQIGNYIESKGGFSNKQNGRIYDPKGLAPTLRTFCGGNQEPKILLDNIKIRKLTPLECWRLMGFEDTDFWKVKNSGISNSQLYKMAGNSIVVNVLRAIFRELLKVEVKNK